MAPSRRVSPPQRRHTVVVVDDQPDMRDLIELVIDDEDDFDVVATGEDGTAAIRVQHDGREPLCKQLPRVLERTGEPGGRMRVDVNEARRHGQSRGVDRPGGGCLM